MRRRILLAVGVPITAVVIAAVAAAVILQPWRELTPEESTEKPATVVAERTTLTSDLLLAGDLTYGDEVELPGRNGIVTRLPRSGDVVAVGQALYEVDGRPVIAVRGDRPFWRDLGTGITDGPDVAQLETALTELGYGSGIT
ncbi:MAG: hypothetical protein ABIR65_01595, partial [Pseudolysinimonas sp.]